jgi:hypothetical protein
MKGIPMSTRFRRFLDALRARYVKGAMAACACIALVACTATTSVSNDVGAAEVTLTGLERVALIYTSRPRCTVLPAVPFCSDQNTVNQIKALDNNAYQAVEAARQNSALLSDALLAIGSFQSVVTTATAK